MTNDAIYPGYSWSLTQHAVGINPSTLYPFLACASLSQGKERPGAEITRRMIENRLLTRNRRDGKDDAWRDYQQVLAELGLIFSTSVSRSLRLTNAGMELLAGSIGVSELLSIQALRYQYPNGQKSIIQSRQRSALKAAGINAPETLIELQVSRKLLIKPALLILRVLTTLEREKPNAQLTVEECGSFLVPIKTNADWSEGVKLINQYRAGKLTIGKLPPHLKRNVQDWFKLLGFTDLFSSSPTVISLSKRAKDNIDVLVNYCDTNEQPDKFWIPHGYSQTDREDWFNYFGNIPFDSRALLQSDEMSEEYKTKNYLAGTEEETDELDVENEYGPNAPGMRLAALNPARAKPTTIDLRIDDPSAALSNLRKGMVQRAAKAALHDSIVRDLGQKFIKQGASVFEDKGSVDLLVNWTDNSQAIFEVKTVSYRSLQNRLRLAIGQLEEYAFRQEQMRRGAPDKTIVVNIGIPETAWQVGFLTRRLTIGLICCDGFTYTSRAPKESQSARYWTTEALQL